ncbi:hypothetical protein HDIA_P0027 (plasmid) [Hartmannibacter diazotrophicus]|uniref:Uncharacterized protein n=1 Tax=Hartmannibacter diazotrophicus TaxID=1482074 RepID=A0A2C9DDU6_9HYPH|nr:hypothetical protein [Hartmannibacter diazotrophicus]SON58436.1 hypothetical protein HDIA_P0027 [Hartmannibacter diazotrophicus]
MRRNHFLALAVTSAALVLGNLSIAEAACPALPYTLSNGQVADANQIMSNFNSLVNCYATGPAGPTNSVQYNAGSGTFGSTGPLTDGQVVIGATGGPPQAAGLTAGTGITITNAPGSVTIAAAGGGVAVQREFGPFAPPTASSFTFIDTPSSVTPTITDVANVGLVYSTPVNSSLAVFPGAYRAVPTSSTWTLTVRAKFGIPMGTYPSFGIYVKDTGGKMVGICIEHGTTLFLQAKRMNSSSSFNSTPYGYEIKEVPSWLRINYDGTNLNYSVSWDGQNWFFYWSEGKSTFLNGALSLVGVGNSPRITNTAYWKAGSTMGGVVTYWDIDDDPASSRTP